MSLLLDTDFCVEFIRGRLSMKWMTQLSAIPQDQVNLPIIVLAELFYGASKGNQAIASAARIHQLCNDFTILTLDIRAAEIYGDIRANLAKSGTPIGPNDLFIAAIALANNLTLVTSNIAEFSRVPNLQILNWRTP